MAALHVSSLPPSERAKFLMTYSIGKSNMTMVGRFVAGLTKLQSQEDVECVIECHKEGGRVLIETLHWLFEAHDPDLVLKCMEDRQWDMRLNEEPLDPFDCYVLGYCFAASRQPRNFRVFNCSMRGECMKMLTVVESGRAFDYINIIDFYRNFMGHEGAIALGKRTRTWYEVPVGDPGGGGGGGGGGGALILF